MPTNTVISYPIPPYQNLPIRADFYIPNFFFITDISIGVNAIITTSVDHNYAIGQQIRLLIPSNFGSRQLNERTAIVLSIPQLNQVLLNISSIGITPFVLANTPNKAQIVAIGDTNNGSINNNGSYMQQTYIDGSFRNISPL